jgi:hypothetical protein
MIQLLPDSGGRVPDLLDHAAQLLAANLPFAGPRFHCDRIVYVDLAPIGGLLRPLTMSTSPCPFQRKPE